jgi:uroporphyrinogen decarboxylase
VHAAIARRKPDRTPRDFWAEGATWNRMFAEVGHNDKGRLLDELGVDIRHLEMRDPPEKPGGGGFVQNFWGERYVWRQTPWGPMRDDGPGALAGATSFDELKSFDWPTPDLFDYSGLRDQCRRLDSYALLYGFADVWERPALVRGWENMFFDMMDRPEWLHFLCRKFADFYCEDYTRAAEATGGRIDLYLLLTDLGGQTGPLISLATFREFIAPYLKQMFDCIHGLGAKVLYHSCGQIRAFIPDLIVLGVDILNPIQPIGAAMAPEGLKADFGDKLCFHGGIDTQGLLPRGSPAEIRKEVRRYCETLGRGGGYIVAPAHNFQPDVPPENILAVYEVEA